ncbi:MAG: hypothetical protein NC311_00775 [Muribaculaceae bacterium]|nr:hypothetical protein [Muribaculaceae bacterium]
MHRILLVVGYVLICGTSYAASCDIGQFYDSGFCYSCPPNATCNDGETFVCDNGFWRDGAICGVCPVPNSTCTDADNFSCNTGFYIKDGECTPCVANATCPGGNEIFHCDDGYYRNTTTNNKCELCGDAAICENGERIKCGPGYRFYATYGRCITCNDGHHYCPDGESIGCQQGYYRHWGGCYACPQNFFCPLNEATDENYTQYCAPGYYHSMGTCVACDDDTQCPGGKPDAMQCADGLYLHSDGRCLAYMDEPGTPPNCNPEYYYDGEKCAMCPMGSTCKSETEFTCMAGHYMDGGACHACPPNATCNDADGIMCDAGYYLANNQCTFCPSSNYCTDNKKHECPQYTDGMYANPELGDGDSVYKTMYIASPYPATKVSQCMLYYGYVDSPLGKYVRYYAHWDTSISKYVGGITVWTETVTGYYMSSPKSADGVQGYAYNNPCTNGPANSHYTKSGSIGGNNCPWICDDGFYRDGDNCLPCPDGQNCMGGRLICPPGMYADKNTCIQCPELYGDNPNTGAENINQCQIKCNGGTYLAAANATECTNVGVGYWAPENYTNYGSAGARNKCPDTLTTIGYGNGADSIDDCGKILHIGNHTLYLVGAKKTTPSLAVQYGNRVLYGNMSTDLTHSAVRVSVWDKTYSIY